MRHVIAMALALSCVATASGVDDPAAPSRRRNLDPILDQYVRDGMVYYRALRQERAPLDAYVRSLAAASIDSGSRAEQIAFWLNAYNALILRTVIDHYPIPQRTSAYPAHSIRQIPGAFDQAPHRVAGRTITLDQIEQRVLSSFQDPRVYLALGRGAIGSGRLRSEAFAPDAVEAQLAEAAAECASRSQCLAVDAANDVVSVSSIFSWRAQDFVAAYDRDVTERFATRSPIERAVLAFVQPKLLTTEKDYLAGNRFKIVFKPFDWSLNDLTGRGGR